MYTATNPRMKTAAALLRGGGQLHIVGRHEVHTLADPDGALRRLVELADGSRSTDELFGALSADYPDLDEQDVVDAVDELQTAGLLEDGFAYAQVRAGADARRRRLAAASDD